ncbi:hypothetical protein B0T22DRAFT_459895 [Podospora appendiculata]|uniref:Dicer-like protein 1 n=1 Tax=Podospora appendiculata TaxID=314037 RepID=A0AAE1CCM9_9PEZI|nr:hypothetical protein B0T22DRAFT_459895 [Podospora appendiculata]
MGIDIDLASTPSSAEPTQAMVDAPMELGDGDSDSDSDSDSDDGVKRWVVNEPAKRRKISDKKRADNAGFELWVEKNHQRLSKGPDKILLDQDKSVNALVRDFEKKKIIASPRDYQLELFERAKTQNTIAVLDTGSGKTLIAALLLRWAIQNEEEDRAAGRQKRIAFFLVDKVALVFQQHAVLVSNLDYPVEKLCGEMVDGVSAEFWHKTFDDNMAIVCTSEILYACLHHSYIRMDQINLLVFDEAHHTKKNHPYARIIKDFYVALADPAKRPRILGMTASPVDAQIDPRRAAEELEALLHSKIATPADPASLQHTVSKPKKETIVGYDRKPADWETELHRSLHAIMGGHKIFHKPFLFTRQATAELGPWCADRFWQLFFREKEIVKLEARTERDLMREAAVDNHMDQCTKEVRDAHELVDGHGFVPPALDRDLLSPKVIELVKILQEQYKDPGSNRRCIVFVKQRNTAMLLADLLRQPEIKIPGVEVGVLVGNGSNDSGFDYHKVGFREQVLNILKFKRGEINCIFATSVAEEGLDIPDCNVVIRFDLYNTLIQYIQSRGRARKEGSEYIHMIENGNLSHRTKILENKQNEDALRKFCDALPEDRKLTGNHFNFDMEYFMRKEKGQRQYTVPETGAKLNYKQSLICLATFVASLPHPPETHLSPEYVITTVPEGYQCEVMLSSASPVRCATGRPYGRKAVAKCSAAFEMCLALLKGKYLDSHLQPAFTKQLPRMRNARVALSSKKRKEYTMRTKPEIWSTVGEPVELHAVALTLTDPAALDRPSSPILLLTRQSLPEIAPFTLFFGENRSSKVCCIPVPGYIKVGRDPLRQGLAAFTLNIFSDIFSKEYDATAAQLPYFLAPTSKDHAFDFASTENLDEIINMDILDLTRKTGAIEYRFDEPDEFFQNRYVVDPYDGSRKFILQQRRRDLKPTDHVPEGVPAPSHHAWKRCETKDILNYSSSLWSKSRTHVKFREDQPVVEAQLLSVRRNLLDDNISDHDMQPKQCFLVLEPLRISPLPVDVVTMAYNFPVIIHRIESNLIALDACKRFGLNIRSDLALEAFTKDCDNSDEHDVEKLNFQAGMGNNYERLELLGDSFLKMATTVSIFTLIPDKDEFEYHVERMLLICNRNLFNNALEANLEEYIRSMAFNRRTWYPEGLVLLKGKRSDNKARHVLADKSIADVCEALIGAAYLTGGESNNGFDLAVQAVTAVVKDKNHNMGVYSDYYAAYKMPTWQTAPANSVQRNMAEKFGDRMGYNFKYPRLLRCAFQHPTYPTIYEKLPSYQRLEFLGDALLDMACVDYLFHRYPGADPQWLTEHKMAMVSNQFLGCLAHALGFHKFIAFYSPSIQKEILDYATEMDEALASAKEDAVAAGKPEADFSRDFWVHCSRPPKCLPDVVEAYVGAMFVDSQYNYDIVKEIFTTHVRPWFEDMRLYDTFANKHPVTFLQNLMQHKLHCQDWRLFVKDLVGDDDAVNQLAPRDPQVVCAVRVHGQTLAHAVAASSRYAKMAAARIALRILEAMLGEDFKKTYGCHCVFKDGDEEKVEALHGSAI